MKQKALIYTAASLALITATAACLSACKKSATAVKGEEVGKDVWEAALKEDSFNNYALDVVITTEQKDDRGAQGTVTMRYTLAFDDTAESKAHVKGKETYEGSAIQNGVKSRKVEYYIHNSAVEFIYKTEKGAWKKTESSEEYVHLGTVVNFMEELMIAARLTKEYDNFRYDKDSKGYVRRIEDASEKTVVKFKNDKLKAVVNEISYGDELKASIQILYTFGGQTVNIPEV